MSNRQVNKNNSAKTRSTSKTNTPSRSQTCVAQPHPLNKSHVDNPKSQTQNKRRRRSSDGTYETYEPDITKRVTKQILRTTDPLHC